MMSEFFLQKRELVFQVYEKAKKSTTESSFSGISKNLELVLLEDFGIPLSYKTFETYYKILVENNEDYKIKTTILNDLSTYLGYVDFKEFTVQNPSKNSKIKISIDGKESVFFSGDKFIAGITGALAGVGLDSREIGLQLRVTPHFITDDTLEVDVFAEQDFPDTNISAGFVQLKPNTNILHPLDTTFQLSHNFVRSNVILKFGQSLILSGLTNKVTQTSKDGIPVIQNIPVLQLFASEKTTNEVNNSIVFILTPRRPGFGKYELSQSEKDMLKRGEHLDRYLGRYLNEVKIEPNIHATLASLANNEYFEEFRLGDVALEDWWHTDNPKFLVEQTLEFMYF